ncbi:MAG TPA: ABC transporter permease, partial [Phycisphaerae bacterium]|nr:ABC transporter permease [Phycisphaerae bacterium]
MGNIWTITRHTLAESIRQKTAMFLIVVLAVLMLGMPFATKGDDTLSGAVQSFLSYSLTVTGFLLACATIFMSKTVSDDLTGKQILVLMTKPLARWQYVLGKWLGIVLLNAAILTVAGFVIYAMTMFIAGQARGLYLAAIVCGLVALLLIGITVRVLKPVKFSIGRWSVVTGVCLVIAGAAVLSVIGLRAYHQQLKPRDAYDAERLHEQVLTARYGTKFHLPREEFRKRANAQFEQNVAQGVYANMDNVSQEAAKAKLANDIEQSWRSVGPGEARVFEFSDIRCSRKPEELIHLSYRLRVFN